MESKKYKVKELNDLFKYYDQLLNDLREGNIEGEEGDCLEEAVSVISAMGEQLKQLLQDSDKKHNYADKKGLENKLPYGACLTSDCTCCRVNIHCAHFIGTESYPVTAASLDISFEKLCSVRPFVPFVKGEAKS